MLQNLRDTLYVSCQYTYRLSPNDRILSTALNNEVLTQTHAGPTGCPISSVTPECSAFLHYFISNGDFRVALFCRLPHDILPLCHRGQPPPGTYEAKRSARHQARVIRQHGSGKSGTVAWVSLFPGCGDGPGRHNAEWGSSKDWSITQNG